MGGVVQIKLTKGQITIIDAEDWPLVKNYKWYASKSTVNSAFYAYTAPWSKELKHSIHISMSRLIMDTPRGVLVDHRDGNTLDNRRSNLRFADHFGNNRNRHKPRPQNSSGVVGVFWEKQANKWRVQVCVNYKKQHIGMFEKLADAVEARRQATIEHYGEFNAEVRS